MAGDLMTFEDSVKAKLKTIVADLIPEERWDGIVRATVVDFEKNDLPKIVKAELAERYKQAIVAELSKPEWREQWNGAENVVGEKIKAMLIEAAPLADARMRCLRRAVLLRRDANKRAVCMLQVRPRNRLDWCAHRDGSEARRALPEVQQCMRAPVA